MTVLQNHVSGKTNMNTTALATDLVGNNDSQVKTHTVAADYNLIAHTQTQRQLRITS